MSVPTDRERWTAYATRVLAREPGITPLRLQQWDVLQQCALDLSLSSTTDLRLYDQLKLRSMLYRSYTTLAQGYATIHQAQLLEERFESLVTELRAKGLVHGGR